MDLRYRRHASGLDRFFRRRFARSNHFRISYAGGCLHVWSHCGYGYPKRPANIFFDHHVDDRRRGEREHFWRAGPDIRGRFHVEFGDSAERVSYLVRRFHCSGNTVSIDGTALPASAVIYQSANQLNISLAGVAVGNHTVSVTDSLGSAKASFTVVAPASTSGCGFAGGNVPWFRGTYGCRSDRNTVAQCQVRAEYVFRGH